MQRSLRRFTLVVSIVSLAALGVARAGVPPESDATTDARIAKLIEQLGDDHYSVRQHAKAELTKFGATAFDALMAAEDHDDLEVAEQAKYLVRLIRVDLVRDSDPQVVRTYLEDYESQDATNRLQTVHTIAALPQGEGLEVLCRIVRFEKSSLLSKQTAALILNNADKMDPAIAKQRQTLLDTLDRSKRPGANWLRVLIGSPSDLKTVADQWGKLADEEASALERAPQESGDYLVTALWRRQVATLVRANQRAESLAVMRKIIGLEKGTPSSLASLVDWLAKEKAWELIGEVSTRFATTFDQNALLLYTLAEARQAQGDSDVAEGAAEKAFQLHKDRPLEHMQAAQHLRNRGLFPWSEREYRKLTEEPLNATAVLPLNARLELSEMLHDQEREREAAETLEPVDEAVKTIPQLRNALNQYRRDPVSVTSRMNYFWSEHYRSTKETGKQKERLNLAIKADPRDADVLIAMFQLPDQTPEERKKISEFIRKAVDHFRSDIEAAPDQIENADAYNQFAWLVGNTEGNFDEAIQASKKSIELIRADMPDRNPGGYLDTLAHCYFAKRDYDNAVLYQTQAAEHEPHSQQIRAALVQFRAAQAKAAKQ